MDIAVRFLFPSYMPPLSERIEYHANSNKSFAPRSQGLALEFIIRAQVLVKYTGERRVEKMIVSDVA